MQRALAKDPSVRLKSVNEILALLPDVAGSPPAGTGERADHRTAAGFYGTVQDLDSIAQDGWKKSAEVIRNADKRAAAAASLRTESIEEPIWKAVRDVFGAIGLRWNGKDGSQFTPLQRALIIFALVVCGLWFWGIIVRLAVPVAICYGVYYIIWASAIRPGMRRDAARGAQPTTVKERAAKPSADTPADMQTIAWQPGAPGPCASARGHQASAVRTTPPAQLAHGCVSRDYRQATTRQVF